MRMQLVPMLFAVSILAASCSCQRDPPAVDRKLAQRMEGGNRDFEIAKPSSEAARPPGQSNAARAHDADTAKEHRTKRATADLVPASKSAKFWFVAESVRGFGDKKFSAGNTVQIWPSEDRVFAATAENKAFSAFDPPEYEAVLPLRFQWRVLQPAQPLAASERYSLYTMYSSGGNSGSSYDHSGMQRIELPIDSVESGTLDVTLSFKKVTGKAPVVVFVVKGSTNILEVEAISNIVVLQAEIK